ncbi:MAG: nuclease-related domain-containing protein [Phormidesmis sp.]
MLRSFRRPSHKRSPVKDRPLRNPGQSLDEAIERLLDEDAAAIYFTAMYCLVFVAYEWWRWYAKVFPHPIAVSFCCGLFSAYCFFRLTRLRAQIKTLKIARDGEKAVGQYLERLRADGYQVFHNVVGQNFNIDHVIIGVNGIFTIETKTYSKPIQGKAHIHFDGDSITANGYKIDRNPVVQSRAQAGWLGTQIQESTGRRYQVQPVVVFPGWFITSRTDAARRSGVWVLNPKGLSKFIDNAPQRLAPEEVRLVSYHLSRYIRTHEA